MRFSLSAVAVAALLAAAPAQAASLYITTGTGTGTQDIGDGSPISWSFIVTPTHTSFQAGVFALKMAPGTSFGIRMELYDVTNTTMLDTTTLSVDDFIAAGGNAVSYARIAFAMPIALSVDNSYEVTLSVVDNPIIDPESGGYSIRGTLGALQFVEADSAESVEVAADAVVAVATPAPASAMVLATALLGLAATRRRAAA